MFIPGVEQLEDGEMRVTMLGSGNPWNTRAQASASVMVEVGNPERDILVFDLGSGSTANYASLKLPINQLNKGCVPMPPEKRFLISEREAARLRAGQVGRAAARVLGVQVALHLPRRVPEEPRFEDAGRRVGAELALCGVESVLRAHGAAHAGNGGPAEERALRGRDHDPEARGGGLPRSDEYAIQST